MSYVTTAFDVPHIFRYGMIDEENGETWQVFYRNAANFDISIRREDIAGTPFEQKWSKYCVESDDPKDHFVKFQELCDLVIGHILPKLQEIAPANGRKWVSFQDYLDPQLYRLQLFTDTSTGDAVAELVHGPTLTKCSLPYGLQPQRMSELDIPLDLPRIQASDITVLDHHKDWRQNPEKAQIAQTGELATLLVAQCASKSVETGVVTNHSLEAMSKLLRLHQVKEDINVPRPLAVVTTFVAHEVDPSLAGLLYLGVPENAKRLMDMTIDELREAHSQGLTKFWKGQIEHILTVLSAYNIAHGGVHQFNVWIDSGASAWLDSPRGVSEKPFDEGDLERLDMVFDFWLVRKVTGEQKSSTTAI